MNIASLLSDTKLSEKYILQKLIMEYMKCSREEMRIQSEKEIAPEIADQILRGYKLATEDKMPLDYILGHVTFFGNEFIVNENTLVPRPETEYMVQAVTEHIQSSNQNIILMDIGTGCGVLWTSVLLQNPSHITTAFFTDISQKALLVAKQNVDNLLQGCQQELIFIWTDLLAFAENYQETRENKPIVLVANLPYIPEKTFEQNSPENVQKREPKMAFVWGDDWLLYYRNMLDEMPLAMKKTIVCFFEMMTRQVEILAKEYQKDRHFQEVKTFHFNIRIIKATYKLS
jgi:release factor glutamine methyltransferase